MTVPLDLLVRVRDALQVVCDDANAFKINYDAIATAQDYLAELTEQIEQQQDSVPAWAWRQAFDEWKFDMNIPIAKGADWIESRALALAQTKG